MKVRNVHLRLEAQSDRFDPYAAGRILVDFPEVDVEGSCPADDWEVQLTSGEWMPFTEAVRLGKITYDSTMYRFWEKTI